jgi:tetratricopeptide (TPR) repeat protein
MNKEDWSYLREDGIKEALTRFKKSLASGRKSYFDVSEFEGIVEYLLDEGDIKNSEIAALQGIQIHPGAVPLQLKYAQVLLSKGKYQNALKYLNLAEQIELTNPDVHLMKGSAWLIMGNEEEAENSFMKALKNADIEKDEILYHIGSSYVQAGEIEKGISYFEKSLMLNPENELALYDLGFFSDQEGEYQKSIEYYNRYLDIDPFNFSIWFNLGISYNKAGEYEKAIQAYEFAHILNEDFDQSIFNIGNAYANAGKFPEAIKSYMDYLELDPENDDALCYIGECYLNLENHFLAEDFYQRALKLNPENETAFFGIGLIMWVHKKWKKGIKYIKKALQLDPSNSEYWITLAKLYNDSHKPEDAENALIKAAELEPENAELWLTWVDVFIKLNEINKALQVLDKGIDYNDDPLLKYRKVGLLLEKKQEKKALALLKVAMNQDFLNINYFFDIYPKALKMNNVLKLVDKFRRENSV